jgi:hypothetical protein
VSSKFAAFTGGSVYAVKLAANKKKVEAQNTASIFRNRVVARKTDRAS